MKHKSQNKTKTRRRRNNMTDIFGSVSLRVTLMPVFDKKNCYCEKREGKKEGEKKLTFFSHHTLLHSQS